MKSFLFFLVFASCALTNNLLAQLPLEMRTHTAHNGGARYPRIVLPADDKGAYILGSSDVLSPWLSYFSNTRTLTKTDSAGRYKWSKTFKIIADTILNLRTGFIDACRTPDGGGAIAGMLTTNTVTFNYQGPFYGSMYLIRFDNKGDTLWCRQMDDSSKYMHHPGAIKTTVDSGFIVCGSVFKNLAPAHGSSPSLFICKINKYGNMEWCHTDTSQGGMKSSGKGIVQLADSSFVVCGESQQGNDTMRATLWCFSKSGNLMWSKRYRQTPGNHGTSLDLLVQNDGLILLNRETEVFLCKIDFLGNIIWSKKHSYYSFILNDTKDAKLLRMKNGNIICVTKSNQTAVFDSLGNNIWNRPSMGSQDLIQLKNENLFFIENKDHNLISRTKDTLVLGDYQIIVTNKLAEGLSRCFYTTTLSSTAINYTSVAMTWAFKSEGNFKPFKPIITKDTIYVQEGCLGYGGGFSDLSKDKKFSCFPNPARSHVQIETETSIQGITIQLFDAAGKQVLYKRVQLDNGKTQLNTADLAPGFYSMQISSAEQFIQVSKLIIAD